MWTLEQVYPISSFFAPEHHLLNLACVFHKGGLTSHSHFNMTAEFSDKCAEMLRVSNGIDWLLGDGAVGNTALPLVVFAVRME